MLVVEHENGRRGYLLAPEKASGLSEYEPINYETQTLPVIMLMAFLGGIILNLCHVSSLFCQLKPLLWFKGLTIAAVRELRL